MSHEICVLARVEAGGTVTIFAGASPGQPGIGCWRLVGPNRVVLVAERLLHTSAQRAGGLLSVRVAGELASDGRTCQARLRWRYIDAAGEPRGPAVTAEADGTRLEP